MTIALYLIWETLFFSKLWSYSSKNTNWREWTFWQELCRILYFYSYICLLNEFKLNHCKKVRTDVYQTHMDILQVRWMINNVSDMVVFILFPNCSLETYLPFTLWEHVCKSWQLLFMRLVCFSFWFTHLIRDFSIWIFLGVQYFYNFNFE